MIDMRVTDLHNLFGPVLPHASTDDYLPVLASVQITAADGTLTAEATDRHTYARKRITRGEDTWRILVPRQQVQQILAVFPLPNGEHDNFGMRHIQLRHDGTGEAGSLTVEMKGYTAVTVAGEPGEFPDGYIRAYLADAIRRPDGETPPGAVYLDPQLAAKWAPAGTHQSPVRFLFGEPTQPVLVLGEDFIGAWMPCRYGGFERRGARELWGADFLEPATATA